ncbi:GrpB protein-domain-containing protein [Phaeosphaeriaceae sp. PMI808]|nr:GrpB protein-domain-containing protein [Phaeosphaeriaceae sp. PMI808]
MSVAVELYNSEWPQQFQQIKLQLEMYLQDTLYQSIEHVGSTSVPGLAAKPIIDIDIIVVRESLDAVINVLVTHGFTYLGELGIADRHVVKDPNQSPPRNTYVCIDGAAQTRNHLGVRNTLRSNLELREEYARVKLELAAQGINIIDYTQAKGTILQKVLQASGMLNIDELTTIKQANLKGEIWGAVKTERLLLREFVFKDADSYFELESNEENARYQDWPPRTIDQAQDLVSANIRNACTSPRTNWELVVENEGQMIGRVGAASKPLDLPHPDHFVKRFALWFSFLPSMQGKGFATEAMKAFIAGLTKRQDADAVELEIECDPRNLGSWRLAERLGFEKHSLTKGAWESKGEMVDSLVYQKVILRRETV